MTGLTIRLLATPGAVPLARHAVREHLGPGASADTELCVSELLTNALAHLGPGTPVTLRITGRAARTRVELTDPDPREPVLRQAADTEECGRGLALLAAVALEWGVRPEGAGGKTVWCELELDPGHSPTGRVAVITGG
ncbi:MULTISPECIES: ATP-binding protein [unclassified Streptomyces]|uniref:ATP-binding protein n=1 Tax=unclassified Streptomyces TaxID=2593676 RepID=UPI000DC79534|nr:MULTISPECIES: ATP-binding protein [unclassified Streptomyces]AWZ05661.1 ATP-binding protein [Streptomyces sp. ICC4]AWZ13360.1 ATP-binding protein [Streptomyces sp. ICC1]